MRTNVVCVLLAFAKTSTEWWVAVESTLNMMMASSPSALSSQQSATTEIIAPEDSVLIIRAPNVRDMYIRVPKGSEHQVTVSFSPIEMAPAERTRLCLISAGHLVTVRTPHHGNVMIPMMPMLSAGGGSVIVHSQGGKSTAPPPPPVHEVCCYNHSPNKPCQTRP
jgi:hypothetical protein